MPNLFFELSRAQDQLLDGWGLPIQERPLLDTGDWGVDTVGSARSYWECVQNGFKRCDEMAWPDRLGDLVVYCWDGSVSGPNGDCPPQMIDCPDGSSRPSYDLCPDLPETVPVPCWDGTMSAPNGDCPPQPIECPDGSSRPSYDLCPDYVGLYPNKEGTSAEEAGNEWSQGFSRNAGEDSSDCQDRAADYCLEKGEVCLENNPSNGAHCSSAAGVCDFTTRAVCR